VTTEQKQRNLTRLRHVHHAGCIVCGSRNKQGLKLSFQTRPDGSIEGKFPCHRLLQGYDGLVHGGVISAVLDSAMTNCLFAHGIVAVTGELTVRFLQPVLLIDVAAIRANIKASIPPLHRMEASMRQNGRIVARATARFMERTMRKEVINPKVNERSAG